MEYELITTNDENVFNNETSKLLKKGFRPFSNLQVIHIQGWEITIGDNRRLPNIMYSQTFIKDGLPSFADFSK